MAGLAVTRAAGLVAFLPITLPEGKTGSFIGVAWCTSFGLALSVGGLFPFIGVVFCGVLGAIFWGVPMGEAATGLDFWGVLETCNELMRHQYRKYPLVLSSSPWQPLFLVTVSNNPLRCR